MKVPRRYIPDPIEDQDFIPSVKGECPRPEKGVLEGRFSLTRLPVLSDDDLTKAALRRQKKGRKQMASANVAVENDSDEESTGKRGREKKYELDLTASGVSVSDETLTKDQKSDDGKVIRTHTVVSKNIVVTDLNGALGLFGADEAKMWEFMSEAASAYYQRTDRQRLNALAQGPEKNMERAIKALVGGGFSEDKARDIVTAQFKAEGLI